jgi:rubredoxin
VPKLRLTFARFTTSPITIRAEFEKFHYHEIYGDELQGIAPGLSFTDLPENYCCGVCGEAKRISNS